MYANIGLGFYLWNSDYNISLRKIWSLQSFDCKFKGACFLGGLSSNSHTDCDYFKIQRNEVSTRKWKVHFDQGTFYKISFFWEMIIVYWTHSTFSVLLWFTRDFESISKFWNTTNRVHDAHHFHSITMQSKLIIYNHTWASKMP